MLYLDSFENAEASKTDWKFAICAICPSMPNIMELVPSKELLAQWQSKEISWEEFHGQFFDEMRDEYSKGEESRLKKLAEYSLENDVALYSPEPSDEHTYRAILEDIINLIWESAERPERVINLAREPVDASQLTEIDQGQMETTPQEDERKSYFALISDTVSETNEGIKSLQEMISIKDNEIQLIRENDELKRQIDRLKEELNTHTESIGLLEKKISDKDEQIQSLQAENHNKDRENDELKTQIAQLQDINTHPGIRDIAVKATREDPAMFGKDFSTCDIIADNLPIDLRLWLDKALRTDQNSQSDLYDLIRDHTNFNVEYTLCGSKFDKYDLPLADVIRVQRNLIAHPERMDERTKMARILCCFFAAALLSPKLQPDDAEAHCNSGIAYSENNDDFDHYNRAIAEYTKAIELKPDYANAYNNRGNAYSNKSDYSRAIADYTKAIELKAGFTNAYYNRGTAYYRKSDYGCAIADLTKAIELKPDYADAYNNRGHAYHSKGDHARAQADFDKAKQLQK